MQEKSEIQENRETGANKPLIRDPEVARPAVTRRRFSAPYKLEILEKADKCCNPGDLGALLRKEGLYSSILATWRRQRAQGIVGGLSQKRGRKPTAKNPIADELQQLRRENRKLRERLERAELIIDIQKKISTALGIPLIPVDSEGGV